MPKYSTWVIKLGGSLIRSPDLRAWLGAIASAGREHRIVIVPGGGLFADAVREAQAILHFDDGLAHDMAMQGMRQFGAVLAALGGSLFAPGLTQLADIEAADGKCGVWIWDPCDPRLVGNALPHDWRVTSDSLSLWLCGEIEDPHLLLVKSRAPMHQATDVRGLAGEAFVDEYFPALWPEIGCRAWWLAQHQVGSLPHLLQGRLMAGHSLGGG